MTRVPVWCEIVCGECATTTAGRFIYDAVPRKQMKAEAKLQGWRFHGDDCYCSETCLERVKDADRN